MQRILQMIKGWWGVSSSSSSKQSIVSELTLNGPSRRVRILAGNQRYPGSWTVHVVNESSLECLKVSGIEIIRFDNLTDFEKACYHSDFKFLGEK